MKKHDKIISFIFILVMMVTAIYWAISTQSWTMLGTLASVVCFGLFVLLGLRTIPVLTDFVLTNPAPEVTWKSKEQDRRQAWLYIIGWILASRILLMLIGYSFLIIQNGYSGGLLSKMAETWHISGIDASSYLGIAENGYVTEGDARFHIVFFPFFQI